jgi:hypothetical protein
MKEGHAYIGNEDIRAIVAGSIGRFPWAGSGVEKVGARGWMHCAPDLEGKYGDAVEWGIYHS